ncbi:flagellar motor switch protein FliN [Nocardioides mangrovi]|uniref:Flagellar motor switch protein FliN n=1 Tax=Nocardioides mangrovi TaxID=2874580 RepID=A0ABS7UA08_9ACTN|nr:flagellar motor switch protein FliN [Nocardioides mangrovi]MBZ5737824.1 flagellar motor switch protein FliN [Nocardioides mangrovi]
MSTGPIPAAQDIAASAAAAAASVLPSAAPLTLGAVAPGDPQVAGPFAGAIVADVEGSVPGSIAILVGQELVDALASSPMGSLDLAAALQPTIDAVAEALHCRTAAARQVGLGLVAREIPSPFTVAYLHSEAVAAAVLMPDVLLASAQNAAMSGAAPSEPEAAALPVPAAPAGMPTAGPVIPGGSSVTNLDHHRNGIELLHGVDMEVTVEIGRTRMTVRDLLDLTPGAVLELDRAAGSPADLLVNGRLIARGEVVVIDEDFGLRITEIAADAAAAG